jgi:MYXO-CTERM domain-containing protein
MELAQDGGIVGTRGPGGEVKYGEGDEEAATDALFPGGDPTGGGTGEGNGEGGGGGESAGEGGVDNGDGGGVSDDGSTDDGSGGCSATGGSSTWLALLSGLGVVALRRRGRREA